MSKFVWTERAKEQLRAIDREQALAIFTDYASSGKGQIKSSKAAAIFAGVSAITGSGSKWPKRTRIGY